MNAVVDTARRQAEEYAGEEDRPLGSYLGTLGVYALTTGAMALLGRRLRGRTPAIGLADLTLMTITTHKVSRLIAKDPVTSPLRAPFTR
jgi:hypothetical protein